jgi:DNA-binding transcriptional MerR regulator
LTADQLFSINQAARSCGLPESRLRYYEQIGVIPPVRRDPDNGYRVYTREDLDLLDAVACLCGLGMQVADMREYLANAKLDSSAAAMLAELMEAQRDRLAQEAEALAVRRHYVDLKVAFWQAVAAGDDAEASRIAAEAHPLSEAIRQDAGTVRAAPR